MVDFAEAGELSVFIDEEQLACARRAHGASKAISKARDMAQTFNMLRANDLIWSFVVNNYLLGKEPFPFDLLYWNCDSTRMPAAMHSFYLRNMYQENLLIKPGGITLDGRADRSRARSRRRRSCCRPSEDHIAPWQSTYAATQIYKGPVKFVLSASGHIAGVINPPGNKYGHWENDKHPPTPRTGSPARPSKPVRGGRTGSAGSPNTPAATVPARHPGGGKLKPIEDAPGSYVRVRAEE